MKPHNASTPKSPSRRGKAVKTLKNLKNNSSDHLSEEDLRAKCIQEIIDTETDYISDLVTVLEVYIKPLQNSDYIAKQDLSKIFSNWETLIGVNQKLLDSFNEEIERSGKADNPGEIFSSCAEWFKIYTVYCANQPISISTLSRCKDSSSDFSAFLDLCHLAERCKGINLYGYLIKPVQRICLYPLLLKSLLKHTPSNHLDHDSIKEALDKLETVVRFVNERKRQAENMQKILEIQLSIERGEELGLVIPARRYILESEVHFSRSRSRSYPCRGFLFNDLLLCVRPKNQTTFFKPITIPLSEVLFSELEALEGCKNGIQFVTKKSKYTLEFPTFDIKEKWVNEIYPLLSKQRRKRVGSMTLDGKNKVTKRVNEHFAGNGTISRKSKRHTLVAPLKIQDEYWGFASNSEVKIPPAPSRDRKPTVAPHMITLQSKKLKPLPDPSTRPEPPSPATKPTALPLSLAT